METQAYVYKIQDKKSGDFYIGSRFRNIKFGVEPEDDFMHEYFSSSKIKKEIKKHPDNFESKILFKFADADICFWYEQVLIKENVKNRNCLNGTFVDPNTGTKVFNNYNNPHTEETKRKISESKKGKSPQTEEAKKKISLANKGFRWSEEQRNRKRASDRVTCLHCGITTTASNIKRWHADNCKVLKNG